MVATAYLLGVSTRRVEKLEQSLGVAQLSKSQVSAMARHLDEQVTVVRNRALAGNLVRAGHAACWYSWRRPPNRSRFRMSRREICSGLVIGGGNGCSGLAMAMPWCGPVLVGEGFIGVNDLRRCLSTGDVESCLWTAVNAASLALVIGKLPAISKAVITVAGGVGKFLDEASMAKRTLERLRKIIEEAKKGPPAKPEQPPVCKGKDCDVTFPEPVKRAHLGSDGKYHVREGDKDVRIEEPGNLSNTITDIDLVRDGVLWRRGPQPPYPSPISELNLSTGWITCTPDHFGLLTQISPD